MPPLATRRGMLALAVAPALLSLGGAATAAPPQAVGPAWIRLMALYAPNDRAVAAMRRAARLGYDADDFAGITHRIRDQPEVCPVLHFEQRRAGRLHTVALHYSEAA